MLSVEQPFYRPKEKQAQADAKKAKRVFRVCCFLLRVDGVRERCRRAVASTPGRHLAPMACWWNACASTPSTRRPCTPSSSRRVATHTHTHAPSPRHARHRRDTFPRRFFQSEGDHLMLLAVYEAWKMPSSATRGATRITCKRERCGGRKTCGSSSSRSWIGTRWTYLSAGRDWDLVRRAIVAGYFTNAAKKDPQEGYRTMVEGSPVSIHPSSALFNKNPEWLVYHELVLTSRSTCGTSWRSSRSGWSNWRRASSSGPTPGNSRRRSDGRRSSRCIHDSTRRGRGCCRSGARPFLFSKLNTLRGARGFGGSCTTPPVFAVRAGRSTRLANHGIRTCLGMAGLARSLTHSLTRTEVTSPIHVH